MRVVVTIVGWIELIVRRERRAEMNAEGLLLAGTWFLCG